MGNSTTASSTTPVALDKSLLTESGLLAYRRPHLEKVSDDNSRQSIALPSRLEIAVTAATPN